MTLKIVPNLDAYRNVSVGLTTIDIMTQRNNFPAR